MSGSIHRLGSSLFLMLLNHKYVFQTLVTLLYLVAHGQSLYFNYTEFDAQNITCKNDSALVDGGIQLTKNAVDSDLQLSVGRSSYSQPIRLWDGSTNTTTNFTTHFSFQITQLGSDPLYYNYGDGIAFFLAPFDDSTAYAPEGSTGGCLGLIGGHDRNCTATSEYPFVAVEFDTFNNEWETEGGRGPNYVHLGIDYSSVISKVQSAWDVQNKSKAYVWITYDSSAKNLSVFLTYVDDFVFKGESNLSYAIDLRSTLPEKIRVGFTSATGQKHELHYILSWEFNSTLEDEVKITVPVALKNHTTYAPPATKEKNHAALLGGLVAGFSVSIFGLGSLVYMCWKRRSRARSDDIKSDMDDDFVHETGPRRFTYNELSQATNNFHEEGKLGEGGFGGVYKGFLTDMPKELAVKKISKGSNQGRKEYVSEVKTISRLRHKNLVQLLGWCHEKGELLLVYEYMPNGSLYSHLYKSFNKNTMLPWTVRYRIAQGLASALLYLHEEWEQCVLHRDIKSSNVMLDASFNAKLGDFGLARLVDHKIGSQTTELAGTLAYLAPECVLTGKVTKQSDVYSFGMVALEIACGRRPVEPKEDPNRVRLIEWVWNLYGEGRLHEAVDNRLEGETNIHEMECLMIVGLWCCHPDYTFRPSIRQVINVLNSESPIPSLPTKLPVPTYSSAQMSSSTFNVTSSSSGGNSSSSGTKSSSSLSMKSGAAPLLSENFTI